jgi:hypothetical protein
MLDFLFLPVHDFFKKSKKITLEFSSVAKSLSGGFTKKIEKEKMLVDCDVVNSYDDIKKFCTIADRDYDDFKKVGEEKVADDDNELVKSIKRGRNTW